MSVKRVTIVACRPTRNELKLLHPKTDWDSRQQYNAQLTVTGKQRTLRYDSVNESL